ncbi:PIN domain-containing protein [Homoserinibacter sp. GY 40078]|uniref:type II toxin-antitoxin system VapC family toxin n=1 Tax=Homoserinibacter sp. GY 40078 TaxID=2603275 RepID=UPI0011C71EAD|nr:PIN domain-containing protein [Homoserinibacter sp. GY 40078]TXK18519.1 type II toxin-antitoxin system VapC family toxin [Homoserinibacter sp. GY 40078]
MIVLDASVMIALLDGADAHAAAAREFFASHASTRLTAHRLTVAETLVQAARADRGQEVATALTSMGVEHLDTLDDPLALAEVRAASGLRMPDCCVLLSAVRERASLATFDDRLAEAALAVGVPVVRV